MPTRNNGLFMLLLAGISMQAWGQDAGTLLRQQEQQQERRLPQAPPDPATSPAAATLPEPAAGPAVTITALTLSGEIDLLSETERKTLAAQAQGQTLDFDGLQALALQITRQLQQKGRLLARAVLPRQDVTAGAVEIRLLEGILEGWQFSPEGKVRISPRRLSAIAHRAAPPGQPVFGPALERGLLLMNDLPGISARARLEPGQAGNSSRLVTAIEEGPLLSGSAWVDNHGNRTTGRNQANALLYLNDPLGAGEQASLLITYTDGLELGRLGLETALGARGLRVNAGVTALDYAVVNGGARDLELGGDSRAVQLGANYPFTRSRGSNLRGGIALERKVLRDHIASTRLRHKQVNAGTLRLSGDHVNQGHGYSSWSLAYTAGDLDLSRAQADQAADALTLKTAGVYHKVQASLLRVQPLPGAYSLLLRTSGQWADTNLDSSEGFSLGGPYGVRAYPVNEASGDLGWLASLELRVDVPFTWRHGRLQLAGFYDAGGIRLNTAVPDNFSLATESGRNSYSLSGAGLAARLRHDERYTLQAGWARAIGDNPGRSIQGLDADGRDKRSRIWLQASVGF